MPAPRKKLGRLNALDPIDQDLVFSHCERADVTLEEGAEWIATTYNVAISVQALSVWLRHRRVENSTAHRLERIRDNQAAATLLGKVIGSSSDVDEVNIKLIQQAIFEELQKPPDDRNEKRLTEYVDLGLKAANNQLKKRNLDLEVDKFKAAIRTKLEAGLEALAAELEGNKRALEKYQELKEELASAA
jgi:hypothetical protein